jgi:GNAT superfamily N-acetyltransferase
VSIPAHEIVEGGWLISDDPARFDLARAHAWIAEESYWAPGIPLAVFERSIANSLVVGAYDAEGGMAAMARLVTDRATFGWLCDVFVDEAHRGRGLSKAVTAYLMAHPDLQGFRRWALGTRDAHGLYAQFGFTPLIDTSRWMERTVRDIYRR